MTNQHPITPPPELVQQWVDLLPQGSVKAFTAAAQWGADCELNACCEWLIGWDTCEGERLASLLHEGRCPKPPRLKEQALAALERYEAEEWCEEMTFDSSIIRRALEQLND